MHQRQPGGKAVAWRGRCVAERPPSTPVEAATGAEHAVPGGEAASRPHAVGGGGMHESFSKNYTLKCANYTAKVHIVA